MPAAGQAIFVDRSGRRKRVLTWVLAATGAVALAYAAALIGSMLGAYHADGHGSSLPRPGETTTVERPSSPATRTPPATTPAARAATAPAETAAAAPAETAATAPAERSSTDRATGAQRPAPRRTDRETPPQSAPPSPSPTPSDFWSRLFPGGGG
ncbi:hypothetical protein SAMN05443668_12567 [Cryptosporangium aurantiacum]|uniref:Uncharacterized protein n=1 Tax=Cryptosporangium aurantiacum TaxID=134849 RepID=A0A1M7RMQ0_9ACTN|nr:hypothetical protein SAMN05443668_12567 [Cryptosporangium aurantiacum]